MLYGYPNPAALMLASVWRYSPMILINNNSTHVLSSLTSLHILTKFCFRLSSLFCVFRWSSLKRGWQSVSHHLMVVQVAAWQRPAPACSPSGRPPPLLFYSTYTYIQWNLKHANTCQWILIYSALQQHSCLLMLSSLKAPVHTFHKNMFFYVFVKRCISAASTGSTGRRQKGWIFSQIIWLILYYLDKVTVLTNMQEKKNFFN